MSCISIGGVHEPFKPAIAQLVEHLTVDVCSYQMVPGFDSGWPDLAWCRSCLGQQAKQVISNITKLDEQTDVFCTE